MELKDTTRSLRCQCGEAERKWKKDKLQVSFDILNKCLSKYQKAVKADKTILLSNMALKNSHRLFKFCSLFLIQFNVFISVVSPCSTNHVYVSSAICKKSLQFLSTIFELSGSHHPLWLRIRLFYPACSAVLQQFEPLTHPALKQIANLVMALNSPADCIPPYFLKNVFMLSASVSFF